ncbi:MAG: methyltransferase domain-containing protein [Oscillospiraceae bacterium]|nr:methyltransferase domain-containing protein [Oscillospiraceae bacterium]
MNDRCLICGQEGKTKNAVFNPFVIERVYGGKEQDTCLVYCEKCGFAFSSARFTDEEMNKLYHGYRDEIYQSQRFKYDSGYTAEYNRSLYSPEDKGTYRKNTIEQFLNNSINFSKIHSVLDYGGDKGQFIPDCFCDAEKFVYEVSGTDTIEGVKLIENVTLLRNYKWDVIMCNQVLEHVSDIAGVFSELSSLMSDNTFLYIEVPDGRGIENNNNVRITEHINFFTVRTFEKLAERQNIRLLKAEYTDKIIQCLFIK